MSEHHHALALPQLLSYLRAQPWAVQASVSTKSTPQAAVLRVVVTDRFELIFDTVTQSRKHHNLIANPHIAFVFGGDRDCAAQYEGIAELPGEAELADLQASYVEHYRDGPTRASWPGLVYWRVRPTWIRYGDFNVDPPIIQEWDAAQISGGL